MIKKTLTIINELGLHARASAKLVKLASKFLSKIQICKNDKCVNGKSIMGIMLLAANKGTELTFIVEGEDELEAMQQIETFILNRFNEKT